MAMVLSNPATAASPRIRSRCLSTAISPTLPLALSSKSAFCGQSLGITVSPSGRQSRRAYSGVRASTSEIPKQFRKEGLKEGLEENFRSVPQSLYGLNPTQMDMFMTEDNPFSRQARKVTEIVPAVTELVIAELLWLDYDNPQKPIYLYINSPGTQNEKKESIGFETEAYAIADTMNYVKAKVYTVNCGQALGQAAMLLAIGNKGNRFVQPNAVTKLYSPKVNQSGGSATEMWLKAKELDVNTEYYAELLARGTGKTVEEIKRDIARPRYFRGQEAVDYGLCDGIIKSRGVQMDRKNYDEMLAQSKATRAKYARPQAQGAGAAR